MSLDLLSSYVNSLLLLGLSTTTVRLKLGRLKYFLDWLGSGSLKDVDRLDIQSYYAYLHLEKVSVELRTINLYMGTLDEFYSWLCESGKISIHPFIGFVMERVEASGYRRPLSLAEVEALYSSCIIMEEKVLLILCYGCGLRASELQSLKVKDVLFSEGVVLVESGKNNQRRYVPITVFDLSIISGYIRGNKLLDQSYLFEYKGGSKSQYLLRKQFRALQMRIGLDPPIYSLHHLRHSIASHLVDSGVCIRLVQQFLGHKNLSTTQNYVSPTGKISYRSGIRESI